MTREAKTVLTFDEVMGLADVMGTQTMVVTVPPPPSYIDINGSLVDVRTLPDGAVDVIVELWEYAFRRKVAAK